MFKAALNETHSKKLPRNIGVMVILIPPVDAHSKMATICMHEHPWAILQSLKNVIIGLK